MVIELSTGYALYVDNLWRTGCGVGHKSVYNIILYYMLKAYGGMVLYIGGGAPKVASGAPKIASDVP